MNWTIFRSSCLVLNHKSVGSFLADNLHFNEMFMNILMNIVKSTYSPTPTSILDS